MREVIIDHRTGGQQVGNFEPILVLSGRFRGETFLPENKFFAENAKLIFRKNAQIWLLLAIS